FSLAQALDGRAIGPGPFPAVRPVSTLPHPRRLALARLAVSSLVDGGLQEGGLPVAQALLGALRAVPRQMRSALPPGARDGGWERWGIHGHGLEAAEYASALDQ